MSIPLSLSSAPAVSSSLVTQDSPWHNPPHELLVFLFSKCSAFDLGRVAQTCRNWYTISQDAQVWTTLLKRNFPHFDTSTMKPEEIKEKCILVDVKCRNLSKLIYSVTHFPSDNSDLPTNSNFQWGTMRTILPSCTLRNNSNECLTASSADKGCIIFKSLAQDKDVSIMGADPQFVSCIHAQNNILFFGRSNNDVTALAFNKLKLPPDFHFLKHSFSGHTNVVTCLNTWGDYLISGSNDNSIRLWETQSGKCVDILPDHAAEVTSLIVADDLLFSADTKGRIKLWDLTTRKCMQTIALSSFPRKIIKLAFDPPFLYAHDEDGPIKVLILRNNKLKFLMVLPTTAKVEDFAVKDGRIVIVWFNGNIATEIEMDFGSAATLKTTLEHISKCFRDPAHFDMLYTLWKRFNKLDKNIQKGIFGCWDRILLSVPVRKSNLIFGEDGFYFFPVYNKECHDPLDRLRADAIDLWIKENLK